MEPRWEGLVSTAPSYLRLRWATPDEREQRECGQVRKPDTLNYRTLRGEAQGLFDETVFGKLSEDEFEPEERLQFLQGEFTSGQTELLEPGDLTDRFGTIELPVPAVHPLWKTRFAGDLENATGWHWEEVCSLIEHERWYLPKRGELVHPDAPEAEEALRGGNALRHRLESRGESSRIVINSVAVLPIRLRPLVPREDGLETSNVNDLYRRVINRSNRLSRLVELNAPVVTIRNEERLLQQGIETLFDNRHQHVKTVTSPDGTPLESLVDLVREGDGLAELDRHAQLNSAKLGETPLVFSAFAALRALEAMGFSVERRAS